MEDIEERNRIDLNKLDNVRPNPDGSWQAACPMCRNEGSDKTGNHLRVYQSLAFHCAKYGKDKDHNLGILVMVGTVAGLEMPATISEPKVECEVIYDDSVLARLIESYDYWINRKPYGLPPEVLKQFEGGVATEFKMKDRYVFPIRDNNGKIHGFTGRYIKPILHKSVPRWKHLGKKENFIFDRQRTIDAIRATRTAILVEGPGCPLALREAGLFGVVPIFGVKPSSALLGLLISLNPDRIFVSMNNELDNTKAQLNGNEATERTLGVLSNFFSERKLIKRLPDKKDWLECDLEQRYAFKKEVHG